MTIIQRLPMLTVLGGALTLPAAWPAGAAGPATADRAGFAGHGRPGDATPRGLWRSPAAGPAAGLALAVAGPWSAAGRPRGDLRRAGQAGGQRAPRASGTRMRGRGS
ncbi:MAG TPA: hypothetical protein VG123_32380 [Streptosporangiaceae bacterium]|nr:hypothetical protein [Streptosporangiaceae bacterium]